MRRTNVPAPNAGIEICPQMRSVGNIPTLHASYRGNPKSIPLAPLVARWESRMLLGFPRYDACGVSQLDVQPAGLHQAIQRLFSGRGPASLLPEKSIRLQEFDPILQRDPAHSHSGIHRPPG